ncbi:MAG: YfhO family protein, partial [Prolixibacteraceae bacterium]|nr:YfhO family protein [Prolixibacteraceae bacterium]
EAIWTNAMFGGMPGYLISVLYSSNLFTFIQAKVMKPFHPVSMLILFMIGFYILLNSMKVNRWLTIAGALAFGFSSYHLIIIGAGHNTKAYAIGYMMIVVASVLMAFRYNRIGGTLLFAFGLTLQILANHLQITYYGMLTLVVFGIVELVYAIREKRLASFFKTLGLLASGAVIALSINFSSLWSTYAYSKNSIRGESELSHNAENRTSGLDKDYIVQWSQGIDETMTLLIPNFKGGSHFINPGINSESFEVLQGKVQNPRQVISQIIMYHGDKPVTSGPYYVGAIIVFLFVLALFVVKGCDKWWLLAATIMSILFAWGKYIMPLTSFLLDYLPLYNKFRAPEMTLVIACFAMPLLAFLGVQKIISGQVARPEFMKAMKWALGITGGVTLLFALIPGIAGDFSAPFDDNYPDWLIDAVVNDRKSMLRMDALRSFVFIALTAAALFLWYTKKVKNGVFFGALAAFILLDLWTVDKRYLNNDNFKSVREAQNVYQETIADREILKDKALSYRVLFLPDPWNNSRSSYFHKNTGGYHAAKLRRYQEMIEFHFTPEINRFIDNMGKGDSVSNPFAGLTTLNMLNTKYLIFDLNYAPITNYEAMGNAWFVNQVEMVPDADAEINALGRLDVGKTAIVAKRFEALIGQKSFVSDSSATIQLTEYQPNYLKYKYNASSEQPVVFSEVYYEDGWKAYVDGKEHPHFRTNYILRGMILPAGNHEIEFKFHPKTYYVGGKVSLAGSLLLIVLAAGYFVMMILEKRKAKKI